MVALNVQWQIFYASSTKFSIGFQLFEEMYTIIYFPKKFRSEKEKIISTNEILMWQRVSGEKKLPN